MIWYQTLVGPVCQPPLLPPEPHEYQPPVEDDEHKKCLKCGEVKHLDDYRRHSRTGKHRGVCRVCHNKQILESDSRKKAKCKWCGKVVPASKGKPRVYCDSVCSASYHNTIGKHK